MGSLIAAAWIASLAVNEEDTRIPFAPATFSADEGCHWIAAGMDGLRMTEAFIAAPEPGQDRSAWLESMKAYREAARAGSGQPTMRLDFDGVRAWTRLAAPLAKALALEPGDQLEIRVDARAVSGNTTLCVALDILEPVRDTWTSWSSVLATLPIPADGAWHTVSASVAIPPRTVDGAWFRPIVGMDGTHDAARGSVDIRDIQFRVDDPVRMTRLAEAAAALYHPGIDLSIYDRLDLMWASRIFTCHFTFMYDRAFYDPSAGYTVDRFLDDGAREFGGYDAVVLWQAYPRIGVDQRNQFDFYRDMPGGLEGIRGAVREFHARGVKVFIDYNPWDRGTRSSGKPDEEALAEIVSAIEADGIFLDTMLGGSAELRKAIDAARPGVVFAPEGHPAVEQLGICNASWAQGLQDSAPPGLLHLKWVEPRHMQHQIRRWDPSHQEEIETAFFNGSGMLVWENVFGTYNPWRLFDRAVWRRAAPILRTYAEAFTCETWDPFYPTFHQGLYAHRWPGSGVELFTFRNTGEPVPHGPLVEVPWDARVHGILSGFNLMDGSEAKVEFVHGKARLHGAVDRLGCYILTTGADRRLTALLDTQRRAAAEPLPEQDARNTMYALEPKAVARTESADTPPEGMVLVPGGAVHMKLEHMRRECGCYPDPGAPIEGWREFLWGSPFDGTLKHDYEAAATNLWMDEAEISNAEYKRFLDATGYAPKHPENFLKHWPNGQMPPEIADLPVVYVDLDDARAYAAWAGKRLPTEPEWQWAAQGADGRAWPWGNEFDAVRCNGSGDGPMPVRSLPEGRSPSGCYHMAGNVWEWTESERDDGHTRFAILRGGSYFKAEGSIWYVPGGPQPCTSHAKFLLMWPGLDRCATIGFRCVKDTAAAQ